MDDNHHLQNKAKRAKRRNFVAKNNKHRAKRHATAKEYDRKPKYQAHYTDGWQGAVDTPSYLIDSLSCYLPDTSSDC